MKAILMTEASGTTVLGQRICILGPSCAGKSTLSEKLSKKLKLPLLHLDQIAFIPGTNWVQRPKEEMKRAHDAFIKKPRWIIDGQYKSVLPQRLKRADTLIFIDVNRFVCAWRFINRCRIKRASARETDRSDEGIQLGHAPVDFMEPAEKCEGAGAVDCCGDTFECCAAKVI